ncbi:MAG: hypothetical protein ACRDYA_15440 [Egibacteraceae bacterium]
MTALLPTHRVTMAELTINYRTPAEIMAFADRVRLPWLRQAQAVRRTGAVPLVRLVDRDQLREWLRRRSVSRSPPSKGPSGS